MIARRAATDLSLRANATKGRKPTCSTVTYEHIAVDTAGHIATIEVRRGPNNFIDTDMVAEIADALDVYDRTADVRAIVLCAEGKHFCAGADFGNSGPDGIALAPKRGRHLYKEAQRLWRSTASRSSPPCMAPPSARASALRSWRISVSPAPRPGSPPTSPALAFTPASA